MKENILEILMYLFENHMHDNCGMLLTEEVLVNELKQAGFNLEMINRAFSWLEGLAKSSEIVTDLPAEMNDSFRTLTSEEYAKIGTSNWGFLMYLEQAGVLDSACREIVIDRLMGLETAQIDLPQVKWVVLMVLFNHPNAKAKLKAMEQLVLETSNSEVAH